MLTLFTYFRSSAAYRVRIALELKGLRYAPTFVHLLRNGGEQHQPGFSALNPAHLVPVLKDDDHTITQSLAILEYLDETFPQCPLLPGDIAGRARVRSLSQSIACDIHPLNNLRVLQRLEKTHGLDAEARADWYRHWVSIGLAALEEQLSKSSLTGAYCHGDTPTMADCCLVPQVFNARRFKISLEAFPTISEIHERCIALPAFAAAAPDAQADSD